jgi:replicative DNA helicase
MLAELQTLPYGCSVVADWAVEDVVAHIVENRWDLAVVDLIHGFHYQDERDLSKTSSAIVRAAKASAGPDFAGTTIVCAAHLNDGQMRDQRSPKRPRPGLHSIKGSSSLKQDADTVMFVWGEDDEDGIPGPDGAIWIGKSRQGGMGGMEVSLDSARMEFVERLQLVTVA